MSRPDVTRGRAVYKIKQLNGFYQEVPTDQDTPLYVAVALSDRGLRQYMLYSLMVLVQIDVLEHV
jgi:hypothetical protein